MDAPATGNPRWLQGSAWLIAPDRVVTNRHVLLPDHSDRLIHVSDNDRTAHMREGFRLDIEFAADDRAPAKGDGRRRVTSVVYVAKESDPVDVAVLAIEPYKDGTPLLLAQAGTKPPENLFVVGHPGPALSVPDDVRAVFGKPDKKRVSFGKLMGLTHTGIQIVHDPPRLADIPAVRLSGLEAECGCTPLLWRPRLRQSRSQR